VYGIAGPERDGAGPAVKRLEEHDAVPTQTVIKLGAIRLVVQVPTRHSEFVAVATGEQRASADDERSRPLDVALFFHPVDQEVLAVLSDCCLKRGAVAIDVTHVPEPLVVTAGSTLHTPVGTDGQCARFRDGH
jgi:hypothetical protein